MKHRNFRKKTVAFLIVGGVLVGAVALAMTTNLRKAEPSQIPGSALITPPPGQPGNAGDETKSQLSTATTPPVVITGAATGKSSVKITKFAIEQPSPGVIHPATTLSGLTSGSCTIILTTPSTTTQTKTGEILFDGHYHFCSLGNISATAPGEWKAKLNVTDKNGNKVEVQTAFRIGS